MADLSQEEIEDLLLSGDVGIDTAAEIIERIKKGVKKQKCQTSEELFQLLKNEIAQMLITNQNLGSSNFPIPYVILVIGVNGTGKTTTIAKLAAFYKREGKKVLLVAADTFRAAAIEQLQIWAERAGVEMVKQGMGSDPASVAYDTLASAKSRDVDVVIVDTAGRLHNKVNLMNELTKIKMVMQKVIPDAPHEILLILDGSTGQNAFEQARQFTKATEVTALALTKLDGTAKGGVVIGISDQFKIPVKYIGIGEKLDDIQVFNKSEFVDSLFN